MQVTIMPSHLRGTMAAPPSKSMAHRLLICAGLASGESAIRGVDASQDVLATLDCLRALGAQCAMQDDMVMVKGLDPQGAQSALLSCRESGSTLRFFIPICLLSDSEMTLVGSETLLSRPLSVYEDLCRSQSLPFVVEQGALHVRGRLVSGEYAVRGNISSQFISGLLFALPCLSGDSVIRLLPPVESASYIDLTVSALASFGVAVERPDALTLRVPGNQRYRPHDMAVEGDYSNAAFLDCANLLGGQVQVTGLCENSLQGDRVYRSHMQEIAQGYARIDLSDCPDLGPVLMVAAAACHGALFTGTRRLRIKESDRAAAMAQELSAFGAHLQVEEDSISVLPTPLHAPDRALDGHNDHRIVMSLALLCAQYGGTINGAEAVRKSYPGFWNAMEKLGMEMKSNGMDQQ